MTVGFSHILLLELELLEGILAIAELFIEIY